MWASTYLTVVRPPFSHDRPANFANFSKRRRPDEPTIPVHDRIRSSDISGSWPCARFSEFFTRAGTRRPHDRAANLDETVIKTKLLPKLNEDEVELVLLSINS
ncbi:hypothetical protein Trydic_g13659 [Trypoxylus dichotomus]